MDGLFTVPWKPSRARSAMMLPLSLLLLMLFDAGTCTEYNIRSDDEARGFIKELTTSVQKRKNSMGTRTKVSHIKDILPEAKVVSEFDFSEITGIYGIPSKPARSFLDGRGNRLKWNFTAGPATNSLRGFSASWKNEDLKMYSSNEDYVFFTASQTNHLWILVPSKSGESGKYKLHILSTLKLVKRAKLSVKYSWVYERIGAAGDNHANTSLVKYDMGAAWNKAERNVPFYPQHQYGMAGNDTDGQSAYSNQTSESYTHPDTDDHDSDTPQCDVVDWNDHPSQKKPDTNSCSPIMYQLVEQVTGSGTSRSRKDPPSQSQMDMDAERLGLAQQVENPTRNPGRS